MKISAVPYEWPKQPNVQPKNCALLVIDVQNDYCSPGFYMDKMGCDIGRLSNVIDPLKKVLEAVRKTDMKIIYSRHGEDEPEGGSTKNEDINTSYKGQEGWQISQEVKPFSSERIFDKTTSSVFLSTDIERFLRQNKITHLVFTGLTFDCCVHSSLRTADDLGFKCLTLEDCCGAVTETLHKGSIESITIEGGVFGAVSTSDEFIKALN